MQKPAGGKSLDQREETLNQSCEVFSDEQTWFKSLGEDERREEAVSCEGLPRERSNIHSRVKLG